ncbi:TadE family type IV pilus minor pilin [Microbacterium deminutum]|uniref:TadE family protein n=1 Tax=Microbacterium deminutum TaxID=344164 RepID=A0ABN2RGN8_9MICO
MGVVDDRGSVVAEFAVALPAVVLVLMLGVAALGTSARQVRLQDAVADAARLAARGEADARVRSAVGEAVAGAVAGIRQRDDLVCVTATAPAVGLPLTVSVSSCALAGGL